ncbi:MAG: PHP domain-containing protein [Methanocorpusculum parvum]|nr:PHP domain-containing protein [Methanocorpusculum parvum]
MPHLTCDLHIHTNASADGHCPVEQVLKTAKARGLDAVAITDHDTTAAAIRALSLETDILVIPGIEVSTKDGHVLILGTTKEYAAGKPARETIAEAKADGCVTIIPHPFHYFRHAVGLRDRKALKEADALEAYNSRYYIGTANSKAARIARRYQKPITSGSDAHDCEYVGFGENIIEADERSVEAVLSAIKAGKITARCTKTPVSTYLRQSKNNVRRKIRRRLCRRRSP